MAPRALLEAVAHNATEHHDSCDAPALSYLDNWFGDHEAHDEEGGGAALILVGVLMCAVGSICQNFGNNVMSLGHRKKAEHEVRTASARQLLAQPSGDADEPAAELDVGDGKKENFILLVGRAIFVTGALLIFGSFAFAPLAMLAPMEAIQFVSNMFFAFSQAIASPEAAPLRGRVAEGVLNKCRHLRRSL